MYGLVNFYLLYILRAMYYSTYSIHQTLVENSSFYSLLLFFALLPASLPFSILITFSLCNALKNPGHLCFFFGEPLLKIFIKKLVLFLLSGLSSKKLGSSIFKK